MRREDKNMKNRNQARPCTTSATIILITMLLSLSSVFLLAFETTVSIDSVTGAIWTTDPDGKRVNGNLYTNPKNVYLAGGPHKKGAAGLPDGVYCFQVTDPAGTMLLSTDGTDARVNRMFTVTNGYISNVDPGTHKSSPDTTRDYGIVVQIWPFTFNPKTGGVYKVWVTKRDNYSPGQGNFGFIPSLSKTDNFKVKVNEVPKYFELWVTKAISDLQYANFYVNYTTDIDGSPITNDDPLLPWTTGELIYDRTVGVYDVYGYPTSFAIGTYIYWKFFISNTLTWISATYGPELISQAGIVNKETLFMISGHKYSYPDNIGLQGWTIELFRDGVKIAEIQTDSNGYYAFIGLVPGSYKVCEIARTDEGWAPHGPTCYEFTADVGSGIDRTFDFYNYKMLRITDTSDFRYELSSFDLVFTPSNDGSDMYKLSSTNPGSFYYNVEKYGISGTDVRIEISLPPDNENTPSPPQYDSPNFILHHTYIGSTPVADVHVYGGMLTSPISGQWVPDWSKDITALYTITTTADGKNVTVKGNMPSTGLIFVTVHIDFQISASLTPDQALSFNDFEYTFSATVYFSSMGVKYSLPSHSIGVR